MTCERSAKIVIGNDASVEKVSVNLNGWEREYVDGADRVTVILGVLGRVSLVVKRIPLAGEDSFHGMGVCSSSEGQCVMLTPVLK